MRPPRHAWRTKTHKTWSIAEKDQIIDIIVANPDLKLGSKRTLLELFRNVRIPGRTREEMAEQAQYIVRRVRDVYRQRKSTGDDNCLNTHGYDRLIKVLEPQTCLLPPLPRRNPQRVPSPYPQEALIHVDGERLPEIVTIKYEEPHDEQPSCAAQDSLNGTTATDKGVHDDPHLGHRERELRLRERELDLRAAKLELQKKELEFKERSLNRQLALQEKELAFKERQLMATIKHQEAMYTLESRKLHLDRGK